MSETPADPYEPSESVRAAQATAYARAAIDAAIATLKTHWHQRTWDQEKALKRIIYQMPETP